MKTAIDRYYRLIMLILLLSTYTLSVFSGEEDGYRTYKGKTINSKTEEPVVFASIYKVGTNIGTVSNSDGDFILKIPTAIDTGKIGVSFIGYRPFVTNVSNIVDSFFIVYLDPAPIPIKEVIVRSGNPYEMLKEAKRKIPENYSNAPFMVTAFYREIIKQNRNYVGVAEAVLDVYKSSYINSFDYDRVKVYKGRKSVDVKKMDTVLFKLQGGPKTSFLLDVAKNPAALMSEDFMEFYNYRYTGVIEIEDRQTYIIEFDQKKDVPYSLYTGKIYLDAANLAISGIEFRLSEEGIDKAVGEYVRKRPLNMKIEIEGANYLVNYREIGGKWYFNGIKSELRLSCKWDKKLFKSKYITTLEMAVTDMDFDNVDRFRKRESEKISDVLADQVDYFSDNDFWGKYNTIKPEVSIEEAIAKLNKKVVR